MADKAGEKIKARKGALPGYSSGKRGLLFTDDKWIAKHMPAVEERLRNLTVTPSKRATEIAQHMVFGSAKRLRPAFTLAGYLLVAEGLSPQAVDLAACSELVHCASLFHDDVIDSSLTRKGRPSANAIWGNRTAVVTGDYIFAIAFNVISKLKRQDISDEYINAACSLGEGIIREIEKNYDPDVTEEEYLDIISRKTAGFFRTATRTGAMLAGAPKDQTDAAGRFAYHFGMAFQITDDVLDLYSEEGQTGKPRGLDIREGVYTLPMIYTLRCDDGSLRERLSHNSDIDDADIDFIADRVEVSGGLAYTLERAQDYHHRALEDLSELTPSESHCFLERIANKIVSRTF